MTAARAAALVGILGVAVPTASAAQTRPRAIGEDRARAMAAESAYLRRDWAAAARLYEQASTLNPLRGQYWYRLGFARLRDAGRRDLALQAFLRSHELGFQPIGSLYNAAASAALAGLPDTALALLERALQERWPDRRAILDDEDFASLRDDPRLRALAGVPPTARERISRDSAWRYDLAFLVGEVKRLHYAPFRVISETTFDARVRTLGAAIPHLSDHAIIAELFRLLAVVGDGHTLLFWPTEGPHAFGTLPVRFYPFAEGLFITEADAAHRELVGARVERVGRMDIRQAVETISALISRDNAYGAKRVLHVALAYPDLLHGAGITPAADSTTLGVVTVRGERRTVMVSRLPPGVWTVREGFATAAPGPAPLWLRNAEQPYWFTTLPDGRTGYLQFNAGANRSDESFEAFNQRVFRTIAESAIDRLIIDLRHHEGGTNLINKYLVQGVLRTAKVNRIGRLFTLVSRHTFSAGINVAADLERWTETITAGEPTGSSPNFIGETTRVILPYSGLRASVSSLYWQSALAFDERRWIGPQILYEPRFEDWWVGRDPVLDVIGAMP